MIFPCTSFIFRLPYWYFKISRFWQDNISRTVLVFAILTGKYDKNIKFRDLSVLSFILFFYVGIKFRVLVFREDLFSPVINFAIFFQSRKTCRFPFENSNIQHFHNSHNTPCLPLSSFFWVLQPSQGNLGQC